MAPGFPTATKYAETGGIILEELGCVIGHFPHEFGTAVKDQQIGLCERLLLQGHPLQFHIIKLGCEGVDVVVLQILAAKKPREDTGTGNHQRQGRREQMNPV